MELNSTALTKRLVDTVPGELIVFRISDHCGHCIVLGHEGQYTVLGALDMHSDQTPQPFHFRRNNSSRCVSYRTEWLVNPEPDQAFWAGNQQYRSTPGSLHLEDNRWIVCFASVNQEYSEVHFDLTSNNICDAPSTDAAPVLKWSVWENRAEFEREADPLFSVTAAQD
ncbi:hypothetical protein AMC82_CH03928 [Rhizobium phaseoli]|nr:hypothetical protein AMC84_CH03942 [Rhizobium phaseoli]ANL80329.1 hypothetical protein AMC82_CH03928 [Rhizobium phaseoli]